MSADPAVSFTLDSWLAEPGGLFSGHVTYQPTIDQSPGSARGIRLVLAYRTEGRGSTDSGMVTIVYIPVEEGRPISTRYQLLVPADVPISYDGHLIRIRWRIEVITDRSWRVDPRTEVDVVVAPVGGYARYRGPHPYRPGPG